jgi:hypothetical protein
LKNIFDTQHLLVDVVTDVLVVVNEVLLLLAVVDDDEEKDLLGHTCALCFSSSSSPFSTKLKSFF